MKPYLQRVSLTGMIILLLAASLFPLWVAWRQQHKFLNDDAYITLTYAKSLASGRGFVFNHPPPTLGTTTPLLALIVAGLAIILPHVEIATIAVFLTAICWISIAWIIFWFRSSLDLAEWQAALIGLVIFAHGGVNLLGMEAYLFAALLVLSIAFFYSRRQILAGVTIGLLSLARGEGVLVLFTLIAYSLIAREVTRKRLSFRSARPVVYLLVGFSLVVLPWSLYAQLTFGSFFPNTLPAKVAQGHTGLWPTFSEQLFQQWMPNWGKPLASDRFPFLNLWWLLVLIGLSFAARHGRKWLVYLLWIGSYIAGYTWLGVPGYWWYQFPIFFVVQLFAALGLVKSVEALSRFDRPPWAGRVAPICLVLLVIFALGRVSVNATLNDPGDPRAESYLQLCRWIRQNTRPLESVAYIEIGYLGYWTENRIVDLAGLTSPAAVPHIAEGDFAWGFWHYKPDYYIYLPDFDWAVADIRANPEFVREYQPIATLPGPRETNFIIYRRISIVKHDTSR